jgi:MoaD family protein
LMRVTVRVFGELTQLLSRRNILELDEGATVGNLANRMADEAGLKRQGYLGNFKVGGSELAILVNGRNIALLDGVSTVLEDGDEVVILPPSAGG